MVIKFLLSSPCSITVLLCSWPLNPVRVCGQPLHGTLELSLSPPSAFSPSPPLAHLAEHLCFFHRLTHVCHFMLLTRGAREPLILLLSAPPLTFHSSFYSFTSGIHGKNPKALSLKWLSSSFHVHSFSTFSLTTYDGQVLSSCAPWKWGSEAEQASLHPYKHCILLKKHKTSKQIQSQRATEWALLPLDLSRCVSLNSSIRKVFPFSWDLVWLLCWG